MSAFADSTNIIAHDKETIAKNVDSTGEEKVAMTNVAEETTPSTDSATTNEKTASENSPTEAAASDVKDVAEASTGAQETNTSSETPAVVEDEKASMEVSIGTSIEDSETSQKEIEGELVVPENPVEEISPEQKRKSLSENIIAGRRFMRTDVFDKAVDVLSVAASIAAEVFGDAHEDTFEANFLYGKALLEVGKLEDRVLANALTDVPKMAEGEEEVQDGIVENPEDVPQDERAEIKQKVEEALGVASEEPETVADEAVKTEQKEAEEDSVEKDVENSDEQNQEEEEVVENEATVDPTEDVEMEGVEEVNDEKEVGQTAEVDGEAEEDDEAEDDEADSMKLAWELLETSRCIADKKAASLAAESTVDGEAIKMWKLNLADVLTSLGEHGIADSKYEQAQKDLTEAISIQTVHLPATSRVIANTTHLLAKAFSSDSLFEQAAAHFNDTKNILIAKSEELKKQLETVSDDAKSDIQSEIKELDGIIPELDAFIVDARASAEQTEKLKSDAKKELEGAAAMLAKVADVTEATDISSMVRRPTKRPASEEAPEETKKRKSGDGVDVAVVTEEQVVESTEEPTPINE
ncbi:Tetratricopeptide SHNi-TPR domain-containing protein [Caenorhabditis elegans]|uniref:Tetratricopeptide SHNi-TPR domain-containing protein n=1 Tax=Caenorhabditis elegans TaxID=6239 RepID=O17687_CAEEL|nr:Tetratricopeptide SHNi-TPR domain-containing protein [Caenorhabditis elegans]CAB02850.1 Tetratricopeptide SHNi-TPR domain-containing protein [Caenorhabditis elegans]|eukprot:NP_506298.1 NASP (human Nuclear Autoantigenic Sperm Protein) homolog [Caenorhabditis elegans]